MSNKVDENIIRVCNCKHFKTTESSELAVLN